MTKTRLHFSSPKKFQPKLTSSISTLAWMICGLVSLGACQPKATTQTSIADQASASEASTSDVAPAIPAQAAAPQKALSGAKDNNVSITPPTTATGQDVSIAGGWVSAGGACDSGASVFFNRDGTFLSEGEKGTWELAGQTLTVTTVSTFEVPQMPVQGPDESLGDTGEKAVLTVLSVTQDAARVILSNGSDANWTRCSD